MSSTLARQPRLEYRPDIDGLRALAVLPVVLYHAGFSWTSGGFVGVDVFFVVSGFLITSIVAGEIDRGEFSLSSFYERRARRLFPALFAVVAASSVAAVVLLIPWELEDFGESVAATALFSSNFLFYSEAGYFDGPAELKPLLHTWSLAIEEQYYLLFPGLLLLTRRYLRSAYVAVVSAVLVASLILSIWSISNSPNAAFYLLGSRAWELMLGSLLALLPLAGISGVLREGGGWLGLGLIFFAVFQFDAQTPFPGIAALAPCVGTALIILNGYQRPNSALVRLLSMRALVVTGLISYSLYLWHWPVLVFARHYLLRDLTTTDALVGVALSLVLAWASWRFIEQPFRGRGRLFSRKQMFRFTFGLMLGAIVVGLSFDLSNGLPGRLSAHVQQVAATAKDKPASRKGCEGIDALALSYDRACRVNELPASPSFAMLGDSHAVFMMPAVGRAAQAVGRNGLDLSSKGCPPLLGVQRPLFDGTGECPRFYDRVVEIIEQHPELRTIVLAARWARHAQGVGYGDMDESVLYSSLDGVIAQSEAENQITFSTAFVRTLDKLASLNREIVLISSVPEVGHHVPRVLAKSAWRGSAAELHVPVAQYRARQGHVRATFAIAAARPGVRIFDPALYFCNEQYCRTTDSTGIPLYIDEDHLSSVGAAQLEPMFELMLSDP